MPKSEPRSELIPDPATIIDLVAQLVEGTWPSPDEGREDLFRRLRFKSGESLAHGSEASPMSSFILITDVPGISFASWSAFRGKFMSVHFHLYSFPEAQAPATRLGHDALAGKLTELYGHPTRPWEDEEVPPSMWKANSREIDTHLFYRRDSSLMLSISDEELATAAEVEASNDFHNPGITEPTP